MQTREVKSSNDNKTSGGKIAGKVGLVVFAAILACVGIALVIKGVALQNSVTMGDPDWFELSSKGGDLVFGGVALCFVAVFCAIIASVLLSTKKKNSMQMVVEQIQKEKELYSKGLTEEQKKEISEQMHQTNRHMSNYFAGVVECKNCGHEVSPGERKCKYCGTRIR